MKYNEWSPAFANCNSLDYHFWGKIKIKVYGDRFNQALAKKKESKKKTKWVWPELSNDLKEIQRTLKQFIPHLTVVLGKDGQCIKMSLGKIAIIPLHGFHLFYFGFVVIIMILPACALSSEWFNWLSNFWHQLHNHLKQVKV